MSRVCVRVRGGNGKESQGNVRGEAQRNVWNAVARRLPLIKGDHGRNATLKRMDKQSGVGECVRTWEGQGKAVQSQLRGEGLIGPTSHYRMGSVNGRRVGRRL